jgi:hypothetical protein
MKIVKQKIKKEIDLPFEIGKKYKTRFATGESFTLTNIVISKESKNKGEIIGFEGIYEKCPHLGICPLGAGRLIPEQRIEWVEGHAFSCCSRPVFCHECKEHEDI